jgi:hypothetical protein
VSCLLIGGHQVHHRPVGVVGDADHGQAIKAEQPRRIVNHARSSSVVIILLRQQV